MIVEQTITGVTKKNVTKKDGSPLTLYDITTSEGTTWTTAKDGLALEAHSRVGRLVAIDGEIKENGRFRNYYINGLMDPGELNAQPVSLNGIPDATPTIPLSDTGDNGKQEQIHRQTATKVAVQMSDTPKAFWENVQVLMDFYNTGNFPDFSDNQFIPESAIAAGVGSGSVIDDDIPF